MPSSRGSSQPRVGTQVSCIAGRSFTVGGTREAQGYWCGYPNPSPGELSDPGVELGSPALQRDSLPAEIPGKPVECFEMMQFKKGNYLRINVTSKAKVSSKKF